MTQNRLSSVHRGLCLLFILLLLCLCVLQDHEATVPYHHFQPKSTEIIVLYHHFQSESSEITESDRRGREFQSASWTVNSTHASPKQAERNTRRGPCLHTDLTGRSSNSVHDGRGSRCIQYLPLAWGNQHSHESRGKGKRSIVVCNILVSLLATWLLLVGDQPEKKALAGLKDRLLRILRRLVFTRTEERRGEGIQTTTSRSPDRFLSDGSSSLRTNELSEKKGSHYHGFPQSGPKNSMFPSCFDWCFNITNLFRPFTRLWRVTPAINFLPGVTSPMSARLDHVGFRLATLAALPSSCSLSRVRLAEGGFHFNPSVTTTAVTCHQCPAVYNLDQPEAGAPGPLEFHRSTSPQCPMVRAACERLGPGAAAAAAAPAASASASASFPSFVSGSVSGSLDGGDRQELSEDSEGRSAERREVSINGASIQRSSSSPSDAGYLLALAGSMQDQRLEPKISSASSTATPPSSSSPPSSHQQSAVVGRTENDSPREGTNVVLGEAVYPQFCTTQSRMATFQTWPSPVADAFPAPLMVDLGFYYAGYADCVRCFYCGVGLKSWDAQDDPLTEHVRWRAQCGFLLATKGKRHIEGVLRAINNNGASEAHSEDNSSSRSRPQDGVSRAGEAPGLAGSGRGESDSSRGGEGTSSVLQQLLTMGFLAKDIDDAHARLRTAGVPEDLEHLLQALLPGTN